MAVTLDGSLRSLVLGCARRRGWSTQRHIAVACGLEESAFSRFLDGRQEIGAVATFGLFREVGIPHEHYGTAFELLDRAQREARAAPAHGPPEPPPEPSGYRCTCGRAGWSAPAGIVT